jgi:hypothetical protein
MYGGSSIKQKRKAVKGYSMGMLLHFLGIAVVSIYFFKV